MRKILTFILMTLTTHTLMAQSMEWLCHRGKYCDIEYMGYDLFKVKNETGKWGVISANGEEILDVQYDKITHFVEERALLFDEAHGAILGIIDKEGKLIKSFGKGQIFAANYPHYKEGLLVYIDQSGRYGYINKDGVITINAKFLMAAPFENGIATVRYSDGYYGLITKSGGSAITSNTKYDFLSSLVDGHLFAVTKSRKGGKQLRVMKLNGSQLKPTRTIVNGMFIYLSDDNKYLTVQGGKHYFIDNQWRIFSANYEFELPYTIKDHITFITESSEILSKHVCENGIQITYMGNPILEQSFDNVETYEKKYAIVVAKEDKKIGVLKLNPSAGIDIMNPIGVFTFYHNTLPFNIEDNLKEREPNQYIEVPVNIRDVKTDQIKCYLNDNGYLRYAPLKNENGAWKLHVPYFYPDTEFNHVVSNQIDIAVTYDGLDWMHSFVDISSKHEQGYAVSISGDKETHDNGQGNIWIKVKSISGIPNQSVVIKVSGLKDIVFSGSERSIPITVKGIPEGEAKTFRYEVIIKEEGCPIIKQTVNWTITNPKPTILPMI